LNTLVEEFGGALTTIGTGTRNKRLASQKSTKKDLKTQINNLLTDFPRGYS